MNLTGRERKAEGRSRAWAPDKVEGRGVSAAFLAEVRAQRTAALEQLERAAVALDDWSVSEARGRLRDLEDLLARNDASPGWPFARTG